MTWCCSVSRWAINVRWQASGSRSTQSSAATPLLGSSDTIGVRSARSRISVHTGSGRLSITVIGALMIGDHERDSRSLRLEWAFVPDVAHYAMGASNSPPMR